MRTFEIAYTQKQVSEIFAETEKEAMQKLLNVFPQLKIESIDGKYICANCHDSIFPGDESYIRGHVYHELCVPL